MGLRVLVVLTSDQRRGAEVEGARLAGLLRTAGVDADAVALAPSAVGGAATVAVPVLGARPLAPATLRALRRRAAGADLVVAYGATTLPACALALAGSGVPFVYRSIGDPAAWAGGAARRWRTAALLRRAAGVVALWPGAADAVSELYGVPRDRVTVVPTPFPSPSASGADRPAARTRLGLPADGMVVAVVGALAEEKRVDRAIDAVALVDGVHLLVAGDGPLRAALEQHAARTLGERATFVGSVDDVSGIYAAADVVLMTSSTEGVPGVVLEAAAAGCRTVATGVGAVPWLAEIGLPVDVVAPDALAAEIAAACRAALTSPAPVVAVPDAMEEGRVVADWLRLVDRSARRGRAESTDRVSVMVLLDSLGTGGTERSTVAVSALLPERGVDPTIVTLSATDVGFVQEAAASGLQVRTLQATGAVGRVRELRAVLRAEHPDVLHTALWASDQVGRLAAVGLPVRVVSSWVAMPRAARFGWTSPGARWKTAVVNIADAATAHLGVDRFHAVTAGVARAHEALYRIPPRRVTVVERGRDPRDMGVATPERRSAVRAGLGLAPDDHVILGVGRLERHKGFVHLVEAAELLAGTDPHVVLLLAGRDGDDAAPVRRAIAGAAALAGRVHLLGHRTDVADLLAAADVFALSSLYEGAAGAVLEAMAIGTPIVTTRLPGLEGVLEDGRDALVCPPADAPALAAAMERVLADAALAASLAAAARTEFLQRFTLDRSADRMADLYRSIVAGRAGEEDR